MNEFQIITTPNLPPLAEMKSNTIIVGYDPDTGKNVRIFASTLLAQSDNYPTWTPEESFDTDEIVVWDFRFWQSLEDDNVGNIPSENAHWTEVSPTPEELNLIDGGTL